MDAHILGRNIYSMHFWLSSIPRAAAWSGIQLIKTNQSCLRCSSLTPLQNCGWNWGWNDLNMHFPGWSTSWKHWSDVAAPEVKQKSGLPSRGYQRTLSKPVCWKCSSQTSSNHGSNTKSYHTQLFISFLVMAFANPLTLPQPPMNYREKIGNSRCKI